MNGKRYIGITNNTNRRWRSGGIEYKPEKKDNQNKAFWNAIQKYGFNEFYHIILETELTKEEACVLEKYYIYKFKTYIGFFKKREDRLGYNSTLGGEGTCGLKGSLHPNYGKQLTKEHKELLSKANSKKIKQYKKSGEYVKIWNKISDACDYYHIDAKCMWECLNGIRKTRCGFVWRYEDCGFNKYESEHMNMSGQNHSMYGRLHKKESIEKMKNNRIGKCVGKDNHHSKSVVYQDKVFGSIRECSDYLGIKYQTLVSWLNGDNQMPKEFVCNGLRKVHVA